MTTDETTAAPTAVASSGSSGGSVGQARLVAMLLGLLFGFAAMGSSATAVAVPALTADLGIGTGDAAWVISLYALTLGVTTAVYGRVSDLVGVRLPLLVGAVLMTLGAGVAALAPDLAPLLGGRLLQGAGAAAMPTLGVTVLTRQYTGHARSSGLTVLAGASAAVTGLGPLLGGLVTEWLGWRGVVALPVLGLLVLPLVWSRLDAAGTRARVDPVGAVLVALTATGLVLLVQSPSTGLVVAAVGAGLLLLGAPVLAGWVRRRPDGFLPRAVIGNRTVVRSACVAAAIPACWFALLLAVPVVLSREGDAAWQVGLVISTGVVAAVVMPFFVGPLLERVGPARALAVAGLLAAGALLLAATGAALASRPVLAAAVVVLTAAVVVLTVAFGTGQPAMSAAVSDATTEDVRGIALGVATLLFLVGGSVGSAVVGGLSEVTGVVPALAGLAVLPLVALAALTPELRRQRAPVRA